MSTPAIQGPVAPYSNVNIEPQNYQPSVFVISAITLGFTTLVTTTENHNYVIGQSVRLIIPPANGCREMNQQQGNVLSIPASNEVILNINSYNFSPFSISTSPKIREQPQIIAIGDINNGSLNSTKSAQITFVQGSFINIS